MRYGLLRYSDIAQMPFEDPNAPVPSRFEHPEHLLKVSHLLLVSGYSHSKPAAPMYREYLDLPASRTALDSDSWLETLLEPGNAVLRVSRLLGSVSTCGYPGSGALAAVCILSHGHTSHTRPREKPAMIGESPGQRRNGSTPVNFW